ncbi:MAG: hypothetical protein WD048_12510 [Chitinophagales bacterium]
MDINKNLIENAFHSKILLFGEYGIIQDAMGLSIPFESFNGKLSFREHSVKPDEEKIKASNENLRKYATHLENLQEKAGLNVQFDLKRMKDDLDSGMFFESTIPQGFGVGSSGALCAAIYDRYAKDKLQPQELKKKKLKELKIIFAQMESYFHGTSSGMDPLICYINMPVLIESKNDIDTVSLPKDQKEGRGAIFLLDSGTPGKTQPLVKYFMERCKEKDFLEKCKADFIPYNDNCIRGFLKGETKALFYNLYFLSKFLIENLTPMIPHIFHRLWKEGLDTGAYYLKLCGSGGGGFILGFTEDLENAKKYLKGHQIKVIQRF